MYDQAGFTHGIHGGTVTRRVMESDTDYVQYVVNSHKDNIGHSMNVWLVVKLDTVNTSRKTIKKRYVETNVVSLKTVE